MCLGVPAKVLSVHGDTALVRIGDVEYNASLALLENVMKGDYVILHAGFAIEKVDEKEAKETERLFREIETNYSGTEF
jgi:hydrogenase expression/formation protein HypC